MPEELRPMKPGHPQYEEFQRAKQELGHEDRQVRFGAAEAFGEIGHPDAISHLTANEQGINDEQWDVRKATVAALGKIVEAIKDEKPEHPAVTSIIAHLTKKIINDEEMVRWEGIRVLGITGHEKIIPHLTTEGQGINDRKGWIRWAAVNALGETEHPDVIQHLIAEKKGINDGDKRVREATAVALNKIAEAIKHEQPDHPVVIAANHINPEEQPNAFIKLYQALERGEHKKQPPKWLTTYAKQLKALEGNLKRS